MMKQVGRKGNFGLGDQAAEMGGRSDVLPDSMCFFYSCSNEGLQAASLQGHASDALIDGDVTLRQVQI